jgi:hypothetical protein
MGIVETVSAKPSRRTLLKSGLATGFVLAFRLPVYAVNELEQTPDDTTNKFAPNAFIRIDHAGQTTLVMPQVEVPKIDVHVIKSSENPGGIGETGTTAGPPALRNALYVATGVALRRLPIDRAALATGRKR